jgi:uncharacterized protein YqgC (DUF456 family)
MNYISLIILLGMFIYSGIMLAAETRDYIHVALFIMSAFGMASVMISYGIVVKKEHGNAWYGVSAPLGLLLGAWIALSTFLVLLTDQGIWWRGSVYK